MSECHRHVGGEGPRRGGPDQHPDRHARSREPRDFVHEAEVDVDAVAALIAILDLGFSQSRVASLAPVNRLAALVDLAACVHLGEHAHVSSLIAVVEGEVWLVPVAANPEPLELGALHVDVFHRPVVTELAELGLRNLGHLLRSELLLDHVLDRLAMTIPAGNVRRVVAAHGLVLDDEVLKHLVVGRAHVDMTVGVRRSVVEDESRRVFAAFDRATVDVHFVPAREPLVLTSRQIGAHREVGLRQVHRRLVVVTHGWILSSCGSHAANIRFEPFHGTKKARRPLYLPGRSASRVSSAVPPSLRRAHCSRATRLLGNGSDPSKPTAPAPAPEVRSEAAEVIFRRRHVRACTIPAR